MSGSSDARHAPATTRNRVAVRDVLRGVLPARGTVLEIAAGTGEHAVFFAAAFPHLVWQPSDPSEEARRSIAAHAGSSGLGNIAPALALDATAHDWPLTRAEAIVCINMIHIAPWRATEGLMRGAARLLGPDAPLYLYGPYRENGEHTAPSNAAFDASLRAQNPEWGVRDLGEVVTLAAGHGFALQQRIAMPANNLSVVFRRT